MFYGQCWTCGERWELGTASTCKCPDELPAYTFKQPSELLIRILDTKPNYNMTFHRDDKQIGVLDFNGPEMVFSGDMDESAKVFFDWIAKSFKARLEQERAEEREACAKVCESLFDMDDDSCNETEKCASTIRTRSNK